MEKCILNHLNQSFLSFNYRLFAVCSNGQPVRMKALNLSYMTSSLYSEKFFSLDTVNT